VLCPTKVARGALWRWRVGHEQEHSTIEAGSMVQQSVGIGNLAVLESEDTVIGSFLNFFLILILFELFPSPALRFTVWEF